MNTEDMIFAGVDISSGRQPVTFAALDDSLNIALIEKFEIAHFIGQLKQYDDLALAINAPTVQSSQEVYSDFKRKIVQAGLKPYSRKNTPNQFIVTNSQGCYRELVGKSPLPRRTLEGRVQRGLVLYDQGLRIKDPMDFFEEITRHHMLSGVFPNEFLYSAAELDALIAAYIAWLEVNEPDQIKIMGNGIVLPKAPETEPD